MTLPGTTDRVRLLISDTAAAPSQIFTDDEIYTFLELNDGAVRLAAAEALDTIASNEAMVSKKITTQDLSTDGPATAVALRAHAASLRAQHDRATVAAADSTDGGFTIVDIPTRSWW